MSEEDVGRRWRELLEAERFSLPTSREAEYAAGYEEERKGMAKCRR